MSHKPISVHAESKASKYPVRKQVKTKTTTKRSVNQKSGFVAPKNAISKVKPAADGKPFRLVANGDSHGVYAAGPKGITRLCGALQPMGQTTDPDGGKPAIRVRFRTHVGTVQHYDIPQELLATPKKVLNELVKRGLVVDREQSQNLASAICMYLQTMMPDKTWLRLTHDGWHQMPDQSLGYMYGDKLYCANPKFQAATQRSLFAKTNVKGDAKDWQKLTRQLGDDHLVVTMLSAGFAAPCLKPLERDATVLTVEGQSGSGKTTGLKLVGSCFGPPSCARRPNFDHPCRLNIDQGWKHISSEACCG